MSHPIIIFDFDSTLIPDESLVCLLKSDKSLSSEQILEIERITEQGVNHEISMVESYRRRLGLASPTKTLMQRYVGKVHETPGFSQLLHMLKSEYKAKLYCVSQGIQDVVEELCQKLFRGLFDGVYAVGVEWEESQLGEGQWRISKVSAQGEESLIKGKQWSVEQCKHDSQSDGVVIMVGDGVSDMSVECEARIAFTQWRDSEKSKNLAHHVAANVDQLKDILQLVLQERDLEGRS